MTNVICAPRSTYSSGRIAAIIPMPTKLNEPSSTNTAAVGTFVPAEVELPVEDHQHDQDHAPCGRGRRPSRTTHEPSSWVQRRIGAMNVYSSVPSQRSTADRLGDPREDDRQVVPEDGADDQRQEQPVVARRRADQRDRQRAGDGVDEERDLPPPVPAGEEEVALDEGVRRLQLMRRRANGVSFRRVRTPGREEPGPGGALRCRVIPATPGRSLRRHRSRRPSRTSDSADLVAERAAGHGCPARSAVADGSHARLALLRHPRGGARCANM